MKLRTAYLQAFGKFIDTKIVFDPTINLIFGYNESGKSTLAEFIFNMLYGQKRYGLKRRIYTNAYNYNKPWHHSLYQGILQYVLNKEEYRIERNFHSDVEEVKIYSEGTGREITNSFQYDTRKELQFFNEQIGLNERIFKNTIYVSQNDLEGQLYQNKENILEEILGKTIYGVESEQGEKTIIEAINELKKIKRDIGTENNKNKPLGYNYEKLREKLIKKYQLENKVKLNNNYQKARREINERLGIIIEKERKLDIQRKFIENKRIKSQIYRIENILNQKQELINYIKDFFGDQTKKDSVENIDKRRKENQKKIKNSLSFILVMFVIVIIVTIWIIVSPKLILQVLIVVLAILISIIKGIKWRYAIKNEEQLLNQLEKIHQYQDAMYELRHLQNKIENETNEYSLEQLKEKIHPLDKDEDFSKINLTKYEIDLEIKKQEKDKMELMNKEMSYKVKMQENNWNPFELEQVERDIYNLQKTIEDLKENVHAIDVAISTLMIIEKREKSKWLPDITKKAEDNIYKITKKYHTIKIDDQYEIKTLEPDSQKLIPIEQLSKGTFNQFYFALRMSMIQVISSFPIKLPIILDEPFINFDDNRFEESMYLLKDLSKRHQIIIFTNQTREKRYLDQYKYNYHYIEL